MLHRQLGAVPPGRRRTGRLRITACATRANSGVTFRYKDYRRTSADRQQVMTPAAGEFIRRFLLHVLPPGFHRIRHYGLLVGSARKACLARARQLLAVAPPLEDELLEIADILSAMPMLRRNHGHHRDLRPLASAPRAAYLPNADPGTNVMTRHGPPDNAVALPLCWPTGSHVSGAGMATGRHTGPAQITAANNPITPASYLFGPSHATVGLPRDRGWNITKHKSP